MFTKENIDILLEFEHKLVNIPLGETIINAQLVEKYIKKLKPSKSQGPDNCHPKFLQETKDEVTEPLSILFNKSLKEGKIPEQWRLANVVPEQWRLVSVVPLHKKGPKSNPENYRPISLTSVVSKLMGKIVRDKIMVHIKKKTICLLNISMDLEPVTHELLTLWCVR